MNASTGNFKIVLAFVQVFLIVFAINSKIEAQSLNGVDLSFNAAVSKSVNINNAAPRFVLQPDNKIIVFGNFQLLNGVIKNQIARLNADGSIDTTFECAVCNLNITSVMLQSDGKIFVAGNVIGQNPPVIYRLNPNGSRDASFTSPFSDNYGTPRPAIIRAIQPDGKLLVSVFASLVRLNTDGSFDNTFSIISFQIFYSSGQVPGKTVVLPDGKIFLIVDGYSTYGSFDTLGRYNPNGTPDTTFTPPNISDSTTPYGSTIINDFDFQADGSVIIAGKFTQVNAVSRFNVAKLLPAGNVDSSFNTSTNISVGDETMQIKVLPNQQILVSTYNRLYRVQPDGSPDSTFSAPTNFTRIGKFEVDSNGKIVLNADFLENGVTVNKFVRLNSNGSLESSFALDYGIGGSVSNIAAQADGKLVIAGEFTRIGGVARQNLARLNADGSVDAAFNSGTGFDNSVEEITVQPDGKILVGGSFATYNGTARASFARLNADGSLDGTFNPGVSGTVYSIDLQTDGKILAGGFFSVSSGGQSIRNAVARFNSDGSLDSSFNVALANFSNITIYRVLVQNDGKIVIGGWFNAVNGFARRNLVRLNSDGSLDTTFNASSVQEISGNDVRQVERQSDGKYLVYSTSGSLFRLNSDGTKDTGFQSVSSGSITSIVAQPDGTIIIGFAGANSLNRQGFARLKPNGAVDSTFFPIGANGAVSAIVRQTDGRIIIGGSFTSVGGVSRLGIARLNVSAYRSVTLFDYDGDGRADVSVFRPSNGFWYRLNSSNNSFSAVQFGQAGDQIAPADYDGDGRTDVAVFRQTVAGAGNFAYFYILNSSDNSFRPVQFGATGDVPLPGDWDGDGRGDLAVYRAAATVGGQSYFYYRPSSQASVDYVTIPLGTQGDKPLSGDFDGDGRLDPAVFRPSTATWIILKSSLNQIQTTGFGLSTDIPVPADYDGDGVTNIAVFRPSLGTWFTSQNAATNYGAIVFGTAGDLPVPADYDGDGRADAAVFRPSTGAWYLNRTTSGFTGVAFGQAEDKPAPNAFIR